MGTSGFFWGGEITCVLIAEYVLLVWDGEEECNMFRVCCLLLAPSAVWPGCVARSLTWLAAMVLASATIIRA